MKKKILLPFLVLLASLLPFQQAAAQTTHAHSASHLWKGIAIDTVTHDSLPIYLYNVATGRFAIQGGTYAMEARLFHEDFGLQMILRPGATSLKKKIYTRITESNIATDKQYLICNIPRLTDQGWSNAPLYSYTTIMDGRETYATWNFRRIESENESSDTHTYYMYQTYRNGYTNSKNLDFYLGAAYGEWCPDGTTTYSDETLNDKGCGYYVHLDDDRSVWTTAGQAGKYGGGDETLPYENTTKVLVNGDSITIKELYQWRVITQAEFEQVLLETVQGINPSVSSLIPDRDFTRNADDFYNEWIVSPSTTTPNDSARYGYTWGYYKKSTLHSASGDSIDGKATRYFSTQAWNAPVRLKKAFNSPKNAKYGFMSFEGVGTVSTTFTLPQPGWYQIESSAFSFAPAGHNAYMYAQAGGIQLTDSVKQSSLSAYMGYSEVELYRYPIVDSLAAEFKVTFPSGKAKDTEDFNRVVGEVLTKNSEAHKHKLWIYVNPDSFNLGGQYKTITIGYKKEQATAVRATTKNGIKYCYDSDWVVADNLMMSYMGLAPAFLYEDKNSLDYLVYDADSVNVRPSAAPDFHYSGALSLERTLKKDQWNSFSLPIPLTGEQVRLAFGEDAHLLELVSIGGISENAYVIDFRTVNLKPAKADSIILVPGKFYLLKPTTDPVEGEDPFGKLTTYYQLGRNFFSVKPNGEDASYEHYWMNPSVLGNHYTISSYQNGNPGVAYVSYVKTPGYDSFTINDAGVYQGDTPDSLYVPGSNQSQYTYAVYGNTIWELNRDMPIKGFRGWITLTNSVATTPTSEPTSGLRMSIDGIVDGEETTGIAEQLVFPVSLPEDTNVYDLFGRRVGTLGMQLTKGIYIVKGKKFYVR